MKSEERHQLLTNDLGVVTTKSIGFFERHLGTVIAVVCVALLVIGVGSYWSSAVVTDNAEGWTLLDDAKTLEDFGNVADKFKGKPPGQWALLTMAEKNLQTAMPTMFTNRELALKDLKQAHEGFESLLQDKSAAPAIHERALWGMALCLETECDGETAKPIDVYKRLIEDHPDSMFKSVAEERIAALEKPGATDFYKWFSKTKPKPPEIGPHDVKPNVDPFGTQEADPNFKADPNDHPDLPAPGDNKVETPKKPVDSPEAEKTGEKPAEKTETPATADPPKPAEGDKPAAAEPPK